MAESRGFSSVALYPEFYFVKELFSLGYSQYTRRMIKPIDISRTVEYELAGWFDGHVARGRMFAAGSNSYWMNAFTDTPQFGGGFDQGIVNPIHPAIQYQLYSADGAGDRAAQIAALWLKAYGVQAITVGGADSREIFRPLRRPEASGKSFAEAMRDGGDRVYWVPERCIVGARRAERELGSACSSGRETVRAVRSLFGTIVVAPDCKGKCKLELNYDGGLEMRTANIVSGASWLGCLAWIVFHRRKR